jgi:hypothetical protein
MLELALVCVKRQSSLLPLSLPLLPLLLHRVARLDAAPAGRSEQAEWAIQLAAVASAVLCLSSRLQVELVAEQMLAVQVHAVAVAAQWRMHQ